MKKFILSFVLFLLFNPNKVSANVICNDGTTSPTCSVCSQGCCSHHGGCSSGKTKRNSVYNSKKTNNYNNEIQDDDDDSVVLWIFLGIGGLFAFGRFCNFIKTSLSDNNKNSDDKNIYVKKSEYEIFCDKVDNLKIRTLVKNNIISNDTSVKYDKISFFYKGKKINCIFFAMNEVEAYYSDESYKASFRTTGRKVVMQNISKNSSAFLLYKKGIFDNSLCASFFASDILVYDYDNIIRNLYNFRSKKLTTGNFLLL